MENTLCSFKNRITRFYLQPLVCGMNTRCRDREGDLLYLGNDHDLFVVVFQGFKASRGSAKHLFSAFESLRRRSSDAVSVIFVNRIILHDSNILQFFLLHLSHCDGIL